MAFWDRELAAHPDTFMQITRGAELALAHRHRKVGLIYGFQDSAPLGEDLASVEQFYKRGCARHSAHAQSAEPGGATAAWSLEMPA